VENPTKPSVADRISRRLSRFTEALENEEVISQKFTCRRIELNFAPQPHDPAG
jgi:hypothetical protein